MFVGQVWEYHESIKGKKSIKHELLIIYKQIDSPLADKYTQGNLVAVLDPAKVSFKKLLSAGMVLVVLPNMIVTLNDFGYISRRLEPFTNNILNRIGVKQSTS